MAYSELIKNFSRIRDYMREFYVYGFKSRSEFTGKSARSYDDERRRIESWLGDYMGFRQTPEGRNVFLSIDSRLTSHNPLYAAWKTKSFTDGDITLHFLLFDILHDPETVLSLKEILSALDRYAESFGAERVPDESTLRKKLKEYVDEGIIRTEKRGRIMYYRRAADASYGSKEVLDFFSEVLPCGVVGSFLLDKRMQQEKNGCEDTFAFHKKSDSDCGESSGKQQAAQEGGSAGQTVNSAGGSPAAEREDAPSDCFAFKHHYITGAMDSEILAALFDAMQEKRAVALKTVGRRSKKEAERQVVPLKIMVSAQSGRQHLLAYAPQQDRIISFRVDYILSVKPGEICETFDELREMLAGMQPHIWGVSTQGRSGQRLEHIEFTIRHDADEMFIPNRLRREKRCGTIERLSPDTLRFSADVYDASELIPWIRTFICRITSFSCSDKKLEAQFMADLEAMYEMYGLKGGEEP